MVALSDSGEQLETEILRYDHAKGMIFADGNVKISTPTDTIYGTGFKADKNLKNWTVEQPTGRTLRERPTSAIPDTVTRVDSVTTDSVVAMKRLIAILALIAYGVIVGAK